MKNQKGRRKLFEVSSTGKGPFSYPGGFLGTFSLVSNKDFTFSVSGSLSEDLLQELAPNDTIFQESFTPLIKGGQQKNQSCSKTSLLPEATCIWSLTICIYGLFPDVKGY